MKTQYYSTSSIKTKKKKVLKILSGFFEDGKESRKVKRI